MTEGIVSITGVSDSQSAPAAASIAEKKGQSLIITATGTRAEKLAKDLSFFSSLPVYILPQEDSSLIRFEARSREGMLEKLRIKKCLARGEKCIVLASVCDALKKNPPAEVFRNTHLCIKTGDEIDPERLKDMLVSFGYERFSMTDAAGQFSVRGDIIDVFPAGESLPVRIELFDTQVDSIRSFYPDVQRSCENLREIDIYPAAEVTSDRKEIDKAKEKIKKEYAKALSVLKDDESRKNLNSRLDRIIDNIDSLANVQSFSGHMQYIYEDMSMIWDYMTDGCIMIDDPDRVYEMIKTKAGETSEDFDLLVSRGMAVPSDFEMCPSVNDYLNIYRSGKDIYVFSPFAKRIKGVSEYTNLYNLRSRQPVVLSGNLDMLRNELEAYIRSGYETVIVCSSDEREKNMKEFLAGYGLDRVRVESGELSAGIEYPEQKKVWISDADIFSGKKSGRKRKKKINSDNRIKNFTEIRKGDYVVHENHGIGRFTGIEEITVEGDQKDYLKIEYAGKDCLYVPVEQMDIIQKYSADDSVTPKINSLGGGEWKKTKAKAKAAVNEMAEDLIELIAKRQEASGYAFGPDSEWQREFEDSFPYAETDDQLRCIQEIKADMEKPLCMDRLLCGDVGFGKTEVAARALFKCVADGKQAAVLVPTTILANQHYYTLKDRFERFPFKVDVLSRFKSAAEQKKTVERIKEGRVDLVIGTHRLLSEDVEFKDLGLLVIDEEQRFGVRHKERIKELKTNVDVLTLSATPIPRTLHMSLSGIRDMSVITEPPEERYPVQTYVTEQDDEIIRSVISRELDRGGQVYVVFNRVQGINSIAKKISDIVPGADVIVGHGKMDEKRLEKVMLDFTEGEYNVLVATTIIENGLDISNVNTIIVLDTDRLGLSQLYQLRGRVGRADRIAYAYFMYRPGKVLTQVAEKRLRAIREFTEFGSGFKIAMRDLEIRGAGNILGTSQSGHMANIGYELYCRFINDAVRRIRGEEVNEAREETKVEIQVSAYIPESYISDEALKLTMYRKIADIHTLEDEEDMIEELIDRFGDVPDQTLNLIKVSRIRKTAGECFASRIYESGGKVRIELSKDRKLNPEAVAGVMDALGKRVLFHGGTVPVIIISSERKKRLDDVIRVLDILKGNIN